MILLFGATGYVGQKYQEYFKFKNIPYKTESIRYENFLKGEILDLISKHNPSFVINCTGYTGIPNVDACEDNKHICLDANTYLPHNLAWACKTLGIGFGHVSSGCIYSGDKNYNEEDIPNFDKSWYSSTKIRGEKRIKLFYSDNSYIWRLRIPFDYIDHPKNFISKIIKFDKLTNQYNSISNINDFVRATTECYLNKLPYGIYNVTNPGKVRAQDIAKLLKEKGIVPKNRKWEILEDINEIKKIEKVPRSNCTLDSSKIINLGIPLPDIYESLNKTLDSWNKSDTMYW